MAHIHRYIKGKPMQRLYRKRIIVGVGGGIAAYKSAELVRRLKDQGAEVRVVMTQGGREFITPLTLQALSGHPVHLDLLVHLHLLILHLGSEVKRRRL